MVKNRNLRCWLAQETRFARLRKWSLFSSYWFSQESAPLPRPEFKRGGAGRQYGGLLFPKIPGFTQSIQLWKSIKKIAQIFVLISGSGGLHGPDGSGAEPSRRGSCWTHQDRLCRLVVSLIIIILVMIIIMILIWGVPVWWSIGHGAILGDFWWCVLVLWWLWSKWLHFRYVRLSVYPFSEGWAPSTYLEKLPVRYKTLDRC